jgi:hypothetical protein
VEPEEDHISLRRDLRNIQLRVVIWLYRRLERTPELRHVLLDTLCAFFSGLKMLFFSSGI